MIIYFEDKNKYNADDVINRLDQKSVYEYFLGESISPLHKNTCPFHNDKSPSLGFRLDHNGILRHKCFGCGVSGNMFDFVMRQQGANADFHTVIRQIVDTFESKHTLVKPSPSNKNIFQSSGERTKIISYYKNFTLEDLKYWNSFGISYPTLRIFNVRACSKSFIITMSGNNPLELNYSNSNPLYSYDFGNGIYKLYRPLTPDKKYKFLSNTNSSDIQGISQLPKNGELLVITSSLKDVMVLYELGISAIAPQSENTFIPADIISDLKLRFKKILIFYDSDKAGYDCAERLAKDTDLDCIFIPDLYNIKDISDFCKIYGIERTRELILKLVNG